MKINIQITSGRGPAECCWVLAKVLKLFLEMARMEKLNPLVVKRERGIEAGTLNSALVQIEGENCEAFAKEWMGTIQWVGQSPFRKHHKRKNWFIGINRIESKEGNLKLKESDLKYETFRSGGKGGQHVNKVETAVRITHIPSGISSTCSAERSQLRNKKVARLKLEKTVELEEIEHLKKRQIKVWEKHTELQRGNPIKVFYGGDFKTKERKRILSLKDGDLKES